MQTITRDQARKFAFDWRDKPLLRVACGESVAIETWDAGCGFFKTPDDRAIPANRPGFDQSMPPEEAEKMFNQFCQELEKTTHVARGIFGRNLQDES